MPGLWRFSNGKDDGGNGKYLVLRRDGTIPKRLNFVFLSADPAAPEALRAYACRAKELGYDSQYVSDIYKLADLFEEDFDREGPGNPDAPRHREDHHLIVQMMETGIGFIKE